MKKLHLLFALGLWLAPLADLHATSTYGVAAGNAYGTSDTGDGGEPPDPPVDPPMPPGDDGGTGDDPNGIATEYGGYSRLRAPYILSANRLDANTVEIEWSCPDPSIANADIYFYRQRDGGEWEHFAAAPLNTWGSFTDTSASVEYPWRYSAVMVSESHTTIFGAFGSDACEPVYVEFARAKTAVRGFRNTTAPEPPQISPPGFNLGAGAADHTDTLQIQINPLQGFTEGPAPSFIPDDPNLLNSSFFSMQGNRSWTGSGDVTEVSANGYVVLGRPFSWGGASRITGCQYPMSVLKLTSEVGGLDTGLRKVTPSDPNVVRDICTFAGSGSVEVPRFGFSAPPDAELGGWDNATYFASQHLEAGASATEGSRDLLFTQTAVASLGITILFEKTGNFQVDPESLTTPTNSTNPSSFKVVPPATAENGLLKQLKTKHELKVFSMQPRIWNIVIQRVDIFSTNGFEYTAPEPPDPQVLQDYLNELFGKQANIRFSVTKKPKMEISSGLFNPPGPIDLPWTLSANNMKRALWIESGASASDHLCLYWVPYMEEGVGAQTFGIPSRGAIVGPTMTLKGVAHEIGHCFGLEHCWARRGSEPYAGFPTIPDRESIRLMGYSSGTVLRNREIVRCSAWEPTVNPLGPNEPPIIEE